MWDVHDNFRLWFVPLRVRQYMRELDLSFVLGFSMNESILGDLIYVIDGIDWDEVPVSQARLG